MGEDDTSEQQWAEQMERDWAEWIAERFNEELRRLNDGNE